MTSASADLLRALAGGIRPAAPERAASPLGGGAPSLGSIASASFADLLAKAQAGDVATGQPVTIAAGAGVELTDDQLKRLAAAADRAAAGGATRALVLIDGMMLRLDVGVRSITGKADLATSGLLTDIDAVIHAPPAAGSAAQLLAPPGVGSAAMNPSLLQALTDVQVR